MKLDKIVMVAVLATTVFCGSLNAATQDDKLFGNGRLLRRLFSDSDQKSKPSVKKDAKPSPTTTQSKARIQVPTPAVRPSAQVPTPAVKTGYDLKLTPKRSPFARPTTALRPEASASDDLEKAPRLAPGIQGSPDRPKQSLSNRQENRSTTGFGMQLELISDQVTVSRIDPRGNAREAGLQKGDVILEAGGIELGSLEAFEEITKILGDGDQVEFEVQRRGKKSEIMIQFGEAPDASVLAETSRPKTENDYSFVPEGDENYQAGLHSVLSQPKAIVKQPALERVQNSLQQTIERQRRQIQQMQQEIKRLSGR